MQAHWVLRGCLKMKLFSLGVLPRWASVRRAAFAFGLAFCACALLLPVSSFAQGLSGVTGTVVDSTGAVVPGVTVTITNTATGIVRTTETTSSGTFFVTDLNPGTYKVKFELKGFKSVVQDGVNVSANAVATSNATLSTGEVTETVEVTAPEISVQTDQPQLGTVIQNTLLQEAPVAIIGGGPGNVGPRDRQIDDYLFTVPGVTGGEFEHRINGGISYQNEVMFNGVVAVQSETQGFQSNINPPFDMVGEVNVLTTNFGAQYGLAQGVASYRFATGTNMLHGNLFEGLRNSFFDAPGANDPLAFTDANGVYHKPVPHVDQHNYGFSVGGPVWIPKVYNGKDKTFFFVAADWFRQNQQDQATMTVPTPAMVQGDFSGYPLPIFVPQNFVAPAGCAAPARGQQWPGNIIPSACFSALSKTVLPLIPAPVKAGLSGNMTSQVGVIATRQSNWGFSIDHNLTSKQALHGSFWRDKYNLPACCDNNAHFSNELSGLKQEPRLGTGLFLTYSNTFSTHLVMTAGFGWMGEINDEFNSHTNVSFAGVNGSNVLPTINFSSTVPNAPTSWGVNNAGETFSINRKLGISFDNNWLWTHGRHLFNIGFEIRRAYQDDHECQQCGGGFTFSNKTTANPADINGTGSAFASFLLGDADSAFRKFVAENRLRNFYIAPYIQDDFKLTTKLKINVGLRWDIMRPFTENDDNVVFFDASASNTAAVNPANNQPLSGAAGKLGTCSACAGYHRADINWHNFSPRLGFVYALNNKTTVLGGYSINFLDGGPYEFGNNKLSVTYGGLTNGIISTNSLGSNIPGYGFWDNNPLAVPQAAPFGPALYNSTGVLKQFGRNPGPNPYIQSWSAGVQRELAGNMLLSVAYVGNRVIHGPSMLNPPNQTNPAFLSKFCASGDPNDPNCLMSPASPNFAWTSAASQAALKSAGFGSTTYATGTCGNPGGPVTLFTPYVAFCGDYGPSAGISQALLPYPMYNPSESAGGVTNLFNMAGTSFYNALQVQVQKRFSKGLSFLVNYTLSKNMSNTDSGFSSFNWGGLNGFNPKAEWSISSSDQPQILNVVGVYELPIGPGKTFLNKGGNVAKNILGGWQMSVSLNYASGTPISVTTFSTDPFLNGFNRSNFDSKVPLNVNYNNYYKGLPVYNTAAFSDPGFAAGNEPRNLSVLRNPFNANENLALGKRFFFGERVGFEMRVEFFNILNRMQVCNPDNTFSDGPNNFGFVSPDGNGGSNTCQGNSPRRGQLFLKLTF